MFEVLLLQTQTDAVEKHEKTPRNKQGRVTGHASDPHNAR